MLNAGYSRLEWAQFRGKTCLIDDLYNDEHGEDLGLEHRDVLEVEGDVEQGQEGVDELEQDQLEDDVSLRWV